MPKLTLDQLNAAIDEHYGDFIFEIDNGVELTFNNLLRLEGAKRDRAKFLLNVITNPTDEILESEEFKSIEDLKPYQIFQEFFRALAKTAADYRGLEKVLPDAHAPWEITFRQWVESSEAGEA